MRQREIIRVTGRQASGLPLDAMTVPDSLADQLRSVRDRLADVDEQRTRVVEERDELIVRARREGGSLREIAELAGLSHQAVKFIEERSD